MTTQTATQAPGRTPEEEAHWIDADTDYDRRKNTDAGRQQVAFEIMRRDRDAVARQDREMFGMRLP